MCKWIDKETGAELELKSIRVVVHRHIDYDPSLWLMSVHGGFSLEKIPLENTELQKAKGEALVSLKTHLRKLLQEVRNFQCEPKISKIETNLEHSSD